MPTGRVTLLCGPAAAGTTTLARELEVEGAIVLSYDREAWARGVRDGRPSRALMEAIERGFAERMRAEVARGAHVVVDASLATREVRDTWRERARAEGVEPELVVVRAPLPTLLERVEERTPGPDSVVLARQALVDDVAGFDWPGEEETHRLVETA